jgi:hypothetical protein
MGDKSRIDRYGASILRAIGGASLFYIFLTCLTQSGSAAPEGPVCGPGGARTLASTGNVRVFRIGGAESPVIYGCLKGASESKLLGPVGSSSSFEGPFVLSGDSAAGTEVQQIGQDVLKVFVVAADLNPSRTSSTRCEVGQRIVPSDGSRLKTLFVTPLGTPAWVVSPSQKSGAPLRIETCSNGKAQILDEGPGISAGSVLLKGALLSWTKLGVQGEVLLRTP